MPATAMITLELAWLLDPEDPAHPIIAGTTGSIGGGARTNDASTDGEFRQYVGRIRLIKRSVTVRTFQITMRALASADADKLTTDVDAGGWQGKLLLLRDIYGRRIWGSYLSSSRVEYIGANGVCDVQFTFVETTYTDEV